MLVLLRINHACMGVEDSFDQLGEIAQQLMGILKGFGRPAHRGRPPLQARWARTPGSSQGSVAAKALGPDINLHAASTCALIAGSSVCWLLIDSDHKLMPALVVGPAGRAAPTPRPGLRSPGPRGAAPQGSGGRSFRAGRAGW